MKALACVTLGGAAAISAASCAAVWGFDEASLAGDGGALSAIEAAADQGVSDSGALPEGAAAEASARPTPADGAVQEGMSAPVCTPACGPGFSCARAVGNIATCVSMTRTCTDNVDCLPSGCCVRLEYDSGVGRCQSPTERGAPVRVCGPS